MISRSRSHATRAAAALSLAALATLAACSDEESGDERNPTCITNPTAPGCAPTSSDVLEGTIAANRTLSASTRYTIRGFVKVPAGVTLTIPAGTVLVGDTTTTSALFVLRGGRLNAVGTASNPIVFTSARAPGFRTPGDIGGLIIVGNGTINRTGAVILEGTSTRPADAVNYGQSADDTDADNSGTLSYVRVEFGGYAEAQNQELNAFTFAAVGRGTTLDHLQALASLDDSFEWFGGRVDGRYLVSYESGDDHFDAAEGYRGRNQYLIALQTTRISPRSGSLGGVATDPQGFEVDGCDTGASGCPAGQSSTPYTMPVFANFTVVGPGPGVLPTTNAGIGMLLRRGTGGTYVNGIVARWPVGIAVRDTTTLNRLTADSLTVRNVMFAENGVIFDPSASGSTANLGTAARFTNAAIDSSATSVAAVFAGLPVAGATPTVATLNWGLSATSAARVGGLATFTGAVSLRAGTFILGTTYRGAADPNGARWWDGWTNYARN